MSWRCQEFDKNVLKVFNMFDFSLLSVTWEETELSCLCLIVIDILCHSAIVVPILSFLSHMLLEV